MGRHKKSEERHAEILEHFCKVAIVEGVDNTSIAKIAQSMKCPPSLIMHYFGTREEMVQAFVEHMMQGYENIFDPFLKNVKTPEELFEKILTATLKIPKPLKTKSSIFYSCYALIFRSKEVHDIFKKVYTKYRIEIENNLKILMNKKIIIQQDPSILAEQFLIIILGLDMYRNIRGNYRRHRKIIESLKENLKFMLCEVESHFTDVYLTLELLRENIMYAY